MREYRRVPALESGSKLSNPDLQSIGEKNYTDIILRYGNLTTKFPQLDTNAKTIVAAINELYAHPGGSIVIPNPPVGSGVELEQGGPLELEQGGVLDTEQGGGTPVGDLTSISIDGDIYNIAGGGTTVVANPASSATNILNTLSVNDTTYMVSGFQYIENRKLYANFWVSQHGGSYYTQNIIAPGAFDNANLLFVSPDPISNAEYTEYCKCGIYCYAYDGDSCSFRCKTKPTIDIFVEIAYCKGKYRDTSSI